MRTIVAMLALMLLTPHLAEAEAFYRVARAQKEVTLKGYTRSETKATLSSEVSGKVLAVNYEIGDITATLPIIVIDTTFVDFTIKRTQYAIDVLQTTLKRHRSRAAYLNKEYQRISTLFKQNSTPETRRDSAAEDLQQAELQAASTALQITQHQTELQELKERRRRHRITAPAGWVVTRKFVENGEIVQPDEPLVEIADYRRLVVPLVVNSEEINAISAMPRPLKAYIEGHPVMADIHWINPAFDEKTRKMNVELFLKDYHGERRGGLVFSLPLSIASAGLRVPREAVISRYENPRVQLKDSGELVPIIILDQNDAYVVIAEDGKLLPGTTLKVN